MIESVFVHGIVTLSCKSMFSVFVLVMTGKQPQAPASPSVPCDVSGAAASESVKTADLDSLVLLIGCCGVLDGTGEL